VVLPGYEGTAAPPAHGAYGPHGPFGVPGLYGSGQGEHGGRLPDLTVPPYLADPGTDGTAGVGRAGDGAAAGGNPWRGNRGPDLTLADILGGPTRRDLDWNRNPGWPAGIGWAHVARAAGRPRTPRHARAARPQVLLFTGLGLLAAAAIMLIAGLLV
jgi:hypothetical protein